MDLRLDFSWVDGEPNVLDRHVPHRPRLTRDLVDLDFNQMGGEARRALTDCRRAGSVHWLVLSGETHRLASNFFERNAGPRDTPHLDKSVGDLEVIDRCFQRL